MHVAEGDGQSCSCAQGPARSRLTLSPPCCPPTPGRSAGASRKRGATPAAADEAGASAQAGLSTAPSAEQEGAPLKRGRFQALEKCGECKHCLNPRLKKACKVVLLQRKALLGLRGI